MFIHWKLAKYVVPSLLRDYQTMLNHIQPLVMGNNLFLMGLAAWETHREVANFPGSMALNAANIWGVPKIGVPHGTPKWMVYIGNPITNR